MVQHQAARDPRGRTDRAQPGARPLRIPVIADAKIPVPPDGYGGTERMVALLCAGLAARGHEVTLIAARGSRNYGRLITHPWAGRKPYPVPGVVQDPLPGAEPLARRATPTS